MDNKAHLIEEEKEYEYSVIDRIIKVKIHLIDSHPFFHTNLLQLIENINSKNLIFELYKLIPRINKYQYKYANINNDLFDKKLLEKIEPKQVYIHKYEEYDHFSTHLIEKKTLTFHINNELWENNCTYWIIYKHNVRNSLLKVFNYNDIKYNTKNINENNEYCFDINSDIHDTNKKKIIHTQLENF